MIAEQKLEPVRKKYKKKVKQLLEVHDQHIDRNGRTLGRKELLTDQTQSITPFFLAYLAFNGNSLPLVIDKLPLLCSHQFRIVLRSSRGVGRSNGSRAADRMLGSLLSDKSGQHK